MGVFVIAFNLVSLEQAAADDAVTCRSVKDPWGLRTVCEGEQSGSVLGVGATSTATSTGGGVPQELAWTPACASNQPSGDIVPENQCANVASCSDPKQARWSLWARPLGSSTRQDNWLLVSTVCRATEPPIPSRSAPPVPDVTWQLVLREVKRVGLPAARLHTQPEGETLVNFDTIFYAEPPAFDRSLRLLGRNVEVSAEPAEYHWSFGDGEVLTTDNPGAPYPAKDVTHQYTDAHVTVHPSVEVVYRARFRVDGGAWQAVPETITIPGPTAGVRIREATPVLSGG